MATGLTRNRQAASAFGGRSGTATSALLAEVRRNGMGTDGCAPGMRTARLVGSAVQTAQAAQAEQLAWWLYVSFAVACDDAPSGEAVA